MRTGPGREQLHPLDARRPRWDGGPGSLARLLIGGRVARPADRARVPPSGGVFRDQLSHHVERRPCSRPGVYYVSCAGGNQYFTAADLPN